MTRHWRLRAAWLVVAVLVVVTVIVAACDGREPNGSATPRGASAAPPTSGPTASLDPEAPIGTIEVPPPIR